MSSFKTNHGSYKGLLIVVINYDILLWSCVFYDSNEEYDLFIARCREQHKGDWDAVYCFNKEKPLKEQALYAKGTKFGRILKNIIETDLTDRR